MGRGPHTPPKVFERQDRGIWDWDSLGSAIGKVAREILEAPPKSTGGPTEQSVRATMADGPEDQTQDQSSGPVTSSISKFAVEAFDAIDSAFGNGFGSKSDHGQTPKKRAWVLEPDRGAKGTPTDTKRLDSGDVAPRNSSASEKLKDTQEKLSILCKDKLLMEKELQKSQELVDLMEGEISALHKKCRQLMLQNEKLRKSQPHHPACCDGEDQVRLQVETLVREKAILARENARLVRENTSMHELLSYSMGGSSEDEHEEESMQGCVPGPVSAARVEGAGSEDV